MQIASDEYIESMQQPFRNRGYVKGSIGIINSDAQNSAKVSDSTNLLYVSNVSKLFEDGTVSRLYAFPEQKFSKVDGKMYFPPETNSGQVYSQGAVSRDIYGDITISIGDGASVYDIKGLTINFGEYYPTFFSLEAGDFYQEYENESSVFTSDDVMDGINEITITPIEMLNGNGRLRISSMSFGMVVPFSNNKVISCSIKDFVSATTESLPSKDVEIILDNQDSFYNPDNEESAIGYLELGQEVKLSFGYDIDGSGKIEWMPETLTYLKNWNASDTQAQFVCTDLFDFMNGTFYKGEYSSSGRTLYDLAKEVLVDAGFVEEQYYIDPYLKTITVNNPVPPVKHSEALQIIANAGRCALYDDRNGRIHLQASFVPDAEITANAETAYSNVQNVLLSTGKVAYAEASQNFTTVDGTVLFMPENSSQYTPTTGFISDTVADENGDFTTNPTLTINLESEYTAYGLKIDFRNVHPQTFTIKTYNAGGGLVQSLTVVPNGNSYETSATFNTFKKMVIEITKGSPNSRVFIDNIKIGDATAYNIKRYDLTKSPVSSRKDKLRNMSVVKNVYSNETTAVADLATEEVEVSTNNTTHTIYLRDPAFGFAVSVESPTSGGTTNVKAEITDSSSYFVSVQFKNVTKTEKVKVKITGKEYILSTEKYSKKHNENGADMEWDNPLVSTASHAQDLEEWLSSYYLGIVDYQLDWRGDPRTDANDLFYLGLKDGRKRLIRAYENDISFSGTWSGKIKARAVVL